MSTIHHILPVAAHLVTWNMRRKGLLRINIQRRSMDVALRIIGNHIQPSSRPKRVATIVSLISSFITQPFTFWMSQSSPDKPNRRRPSQSTSIFRRVLVLQLRQLLILVCEPLDCCRFELYLVITSRKRKTVRVVRIQYR